MCAARTKAARCTMSASPSDLIFGCKNTGNCNCCTRLLSAFDSGAVDFLSRPLHSNVNMERFTAAMRVVTINTPALNLANLRFFHVPDTAFEFSTGSEITQLRFGQCGEQIKARLV